jgi:predicted nucleic acid-binding protein
MLVIDTSVAVKWVVPEGGERIEAGTEAALALLADELIAPDCILGEFANAMFKKVQRNEIGEQQARAAFAILPETVSFFPTASLVEPALVLAFDIIHPVHDCVFLVGALQRGVPLITADAKFHGKCTRTGRPYPIKMLGRET